MKTNPEFENFTSFMDKLAKVPHSEVKAALDAEKAEKADKRHEDKLAKGMAEQLDPAGIHFNRGVDDNLPLQTFNEVMMKQARRKVN
jgi:ribosomal protein L9